MAKNITKVGLRADMTIDDQPVAVEGLLGGDFFLQLSQPAVLGTPISFAYWLKDTYSVDGLDIMLPYVDTTDPNKKGVQIFKDKFNNYKKNNNTKDLEKDIGDRLSNIPESVKNLMVTALLAEVTITDLLIDIKKADEKKMMFGLSVEFTKELELLPNINVNKVSIVVTNAPEDYKFPPRVKLLPPAESASGFISFAANPTNDEEITLGDDVWTFTKDGDTDRSAKQVKLGDNIETTLSYLQTALNDSDSESTAKCNYKVDKTKLIITFNEVGVSGNTFKIGSGNSANSVSSSTLLCK